MDIMILTVVFIVYIFALMGVGYYAYKKTNSSEDFMIAGKDTHPFIMAMSYGATFISTAAIVGFGGVAGEYAMVGFFKYYYWCIHSFCVFRKKDSSNGACIGFINISGVFR